MLPTVWSRCQPVRFEAPSPEAICERLGRHGIPPEHATACARLALGDAEVALGLALGEGPAIRVRAEAFARAAIEAELVGRPWVGLLEAAAGRAKAAGDELEEQLLADLDLMPAKEQARARREAAEAAKRASRRAQTDSLDLALQLSGLWLRDVAVTVDGAPELVHHTDRAEAIEQDAARYAAAHALRGGVTAIDDTRFALRKVNATAELAVEALAFRLTRELRVGQRPQ